MAQSLAKATKMRWHRPVFTLVFAVVALFMVAAPSLAAVAVITNRTEKEVKFTLLTPSGDEQRPKAADHKLASGDLTVVNLKRGETAKLLLGAAKYDLQPDAAYYFGATSASKVELAQIGLVGMPDPKQVPLPAPPLGDKQGADDDGRTIPVKLLVDEEENSKPAVWQRRLKDRVAQVSA